MRVCRDFIWRGTWKLPAGPGRRERAAGRSGATHAARAHSASATSATSRAGRPTRSRKFARTHSQIRIRKKKTNHFRIFPYKVTIPLVLYKKSGGQYLISNALAKFVQMFLLQEYTYNLSYRTIRNFEPNTESKAGNTLKGYGCQRY